MLLAGAGLAASIALGACRQEPNGSPTPDDAPASAPAAAPSATVLPAAAALPTTTTAPPTTVAPTTTTLPTATTTPPTTSAPAATTPPTTTAPPTTTTPPTTVAPTTTAPPTTTLPAAAAARSDTAASSAPPVEKEPRSFTIAATGDLLIHGPVADRARTADGWNFTPMFSMVAPRLPSADLAVCHVESPMSPDNTGLSGYPRFLVPNQLAEAIREAGYDTCSLASNHSADWGADGAAGTIEALDRAGVAHAGMARSPPEQKRINLLEVKGAWVAHLSYTYGLNTGALPAERSYLANLIDEAAILGEARRARTAGAGFVILSLHWGAEYRRLPTRYQTGLGARLLSSPDIDLILGHHAHVVQPVVEIDGEYLVYGLGNFLSNQSNRRCPGCPPGIQDGVILHLTVTEDRTSGRWRVSAVSHTPTRVDLATFRIVVVIDPAAGYDTDEMAASARRTASALGALGTAPSIHIWPEHRIDSRWLYGKR